MKLSDNLQSLQLKLGNKQEKLQYVRTELLTEKQEELNALWAENWVARKICIKRPQDMVRRWRAVYSNDLKADQLEAFEKLEQQLKLREIIGEALSWSSLYGAVALLIVIDAMSLNMPLQPTEHIKRLVILPKWKISANGERDDDVLSPNFARFSYYQINNALLVHHSRLIILNAAKSPLSDEDIWGISDLEAVVSALKRFDGASTNIGDLIYESKIDIFKIAGLSDKITSGLESDVARVISSVQAIKSATNSLLLDPENEYEQKELSFGGLKDLLVEFRNAVAGAADMPVTILFGQSAAGFASGQEDIDNYHESIHRLQEERLRPVLERLDPLLCNMAFGHYPQDWWFEFLPLKELSQEQQMTMLNTFAGATHTLIQNAVLTEHQVANELKESGLFASISAEDVALLEQQKDDFEPSGSAEDEETAENQEV